MYSSSIYPRWWDGGGMRSTNIANCVPRSVLLQGSRTLQRAHCAVHPCKCDGSSSKVFFFQIAPMIRELMIGEAGHLQIAQNSGSYSSGTKGENQVADLNGYLCNSFFHTQLVQMPPLFWEETFLCHGGGPNALKYLRPKKIIHCHVLLNSPST